MQPEYMLVCILAGLKFILLLKFYSYDIIDCACCHENVVQLLMNDTWLNEPLFKHCIAISKVEVILFHEIFYMINEYKHGEKQWRDLDIHDADNCNAMSFTNWSR